MFKVYFEDDTLNQCCSLAFSQVKWFSHMLYLVEKKGLGEDLRQTIYLAGVEAWRAGLSPDKDWKEICKMAQKAIYRFFTAYGFYKPKGSGQFKLREVSVPSLGTDQREILDYLKIKDPIAFEALLAWARGSKKSPPEWAIKNLQEVLDDSPF